MTQIKIFTDGSFNKKYKKSGYGVYFPNGEIPNISEKFTLLPLTNQRAELYAIYAALLKATKKKAIDKITIYSDSKYSIDSLTKWIDKWKINGWKTATNKPVKNLDIILMIDAIIVKYKGIINFIHVNSHTNGLDFNSKSNNEADILAKNGSIKQ